MAETLISPGVLARENDQSFITQQPVTVGAAIIGPTPKGPVEIPTVVTTYSDYLNKFGGAFLSGGQEYSYLTQIAAYNYFQQGGESLLVARVASGSFSPASSSGIVNSLAGSTGTLASLSFSGSDWLGDTTYAGGPSVTSSNAAVAIEIGNNTYFLAAATFNSTNDALDYKYFNINSTTTYTSGAYFAALASGINTWGELATYVSASYNSTTNVFTLSGSPSLSPLNTQANGWELIYGGYIGWPTIFFSGSAGLLAGGTNGTFSEALVLKTISEGTIMNNDTVQGANGTLPSGSSDNVRWQIVSPDTSSGTFTLLVRQGDDTATEPAVLETWTNVSLDPTQPNFISRVIGDSYQTYNQSENYVEAIGNYPNNSRYVYVSSINYLTPNYFDNNGTAKPQYTASIPLAASGAFGGAIGDLFYGGGAKFYDAITGTTNLQGIDADDYDDMIALMANQDDYRFNVITAPGLNLTDNTTQLTTLANTAQSRGDSIAVLDPVPYGSSIGQATTAASAINNSYAATYWPWLQTIDPGTGQLVWVPAATMIPAVYAFTDSVSEPWFAPAGINRGGLDTVVRAERKLSQTNRNDLYVGNVNPIATFPGTGVVVYGQKTLQKKASALDRVNVRRLLIALKSYISQVSNNLVFEQNTIATRNQFLSQVNPYLESVQQRQGLYAFRVIMDDSNNTPDVIDRNQLVGQIYLQPTKTAEFIYLDFNILPTGATFPA
jgi:hypothetical protein